MVDNDYLMFYYQVIKCIYLNTDSYKNLIIRRNKYAEISVTDPE